MQGKRVKKDTVRLPEASGDRFSESSVGKSILHLGESTVAGVGVELIQQGLSANTAHHLNAQSNSDKQFHWSCIGQNGATTNELLTNADVQQQIKALDGAPDILLITVGVNDTTGFVSTKDWHNNLEKLVDAVASEKTEVFFTAVPSMHRFPALPTPLNWLLGARAKLLDEHLKSLCENKGWCYIAAEIALQPEWMAKDGYHPNADGYRIWGEKIATTILTHSR